jgi:O-antigen/teichoic acid export membrane protein
LISLGGRFFILQIAAVIIYQSDMIIIAQLFTPEDVTPYNLSFRYFNMVMVVFNFFIAPLWSAFTEAFVKEEIKWIKDVIRKTLRIWFGFIFITILLFLFSNIFFQFWVGNTVKVPHILSFVLMLYFIVIMWNGIYSNFLNGVGKIRMQMNISLIGTIINIPLAIIFVKVFHFGVEGVLMSSLILNLISAIVAPIQYNLIINKRATGIWNK